MSSKDISVELTLMAEQLEALSRDEQLPTAVRRKVERLVRHAQRLAGQLSQGRAARARVLNHADRVFMARLNKAIDENILVTDIDLGFLTAQLSMSHSTLYRRVKSLTGLTASEYVRKRRLLHCRQLLESGDYNVGEAAMMTGFNQMAHFRAMFKHEFGVLPSEVRR